MTYSADSIGGTVGNTALVGAGNQFTVSNLDNTNSGSFAGILIKTGGASSGDPNIIYTVDGVTSFGTGIDNSDSDKFKLSITQGVGINDAFTCTTTGVIRKPLTAAFRATSTSVTNVTGAGTQYQYGSGLAFTTNFDQNGNFYPGDGAGTPASFTAPVTGKYWIGIEATWGNLTAAMTTGILTFNGSVMGTRNFFAGNIGAMRGGASFVDNLIITANQFIELQAGEVVTWATIIFNGAGDTVTASAYVWGNLVC